MSEYHVIFTTCDTVGSVHGGYRPESMSRTQLSEICFISLINSFQFANIIPKVTIVADKITDELLEFFLNNGYDDIVYPEYKHDIEYNGLEKGRMLSWLEKSYEVLSRPSIKEDTIICQCEDDYFFLKNSISAIDDMINQSSLYLHEYNTDKLLIHPNDEPQRYNPQNITVNKDLKYAVFLSNDRHWIQSNSSNHTFFVRKKTIGNSPALTNAYIHPDIHKREPMLWEHTKQHLGIRPIPGLANHMADTNTSNLLEWKKELKELVDGLDK